MSTPKCAVVIPTKNAMPGFRGVLEMVAAQKTPWPFETIVIDSGSRDGTVACAESFEGVRVISIDPASFGHGRTRNQAIAATDAEFVALLTHDAKPLNDAWLRTLVETAEQDGRIAGVFGRHVARENASPFVKRDLDVHFEGFLKHPLVVDRYLDPEKYEHDLGWRQFLHFYSDNNSLMRRSVWEEIPYPDVEFAEDQLWAREIIEEGRAKAYAPDAVVVHSHDYGALEQLRRAFDESRNFEKYFGYRLSGSIVSALGGVAAAFVEAMTQKIDPQAYGPVGLGDRLRRGAQRMALIAGHYLGANHQRLPSSWAQKLSLDQQLFDA